MILLVIILNYISLNLNSLIILFLLISQYIKFYLFIAKHYIDKKLIHPYYQLLSHYNSHLYLSVSIIKSCFFCI